jgi:hypothetical protein
MTTAALTLAFVMLTPTGLYIAGIALVTVLVVGCVSSIVCYIKARELVPRLLRIQDVQKRIVAEEGRLEELKVEVATRVTELTKAERIIAHGANEQAWLESNRTKSEELKVEVAGLQARVNEEAAKLMRAQEDVEKYENKLKQLAEDHLKATNLKNALDIQIATREQTKESLDKQIASLTELRTQVDSLRVESQELELSAKELHRKFETAAAELRDKEADLAAARVLIGQADAAKQVLAQLDKTRDMSEDRWKDLDRPVFECDSAPKKSTIDEKAWLESFVSRLNGNGFVFNPRAVRAFHAGLKCSETSPLVILAGISGTGKSLLPELYAASVGSNFLSVAVQPRWDSPQDLFGFYNYMEGRYKATELSRLLWQFDKYNNPKARKLFDRNMPLSIVLLDEMNLARVEYYFSDLLSKLEIRTGINSDNSDDRRRAEIELECNAMAKADQSRRLFVGLNTLFIGTMNEDESTQALSEKVLDRANVIRFGRPRDLAVAPRKDSFLREAAEFGSAITFENWRAWCNRTLDPADRKTLKGAVGELNDAMSAIGRPFGHRVSLAIERYIAVYPGSFNEGLADQIEMKILPKLNGLDGQSDGFRQLVQKLSAVIATVRDDALMEAFESSCQQASSSFFKWRGVMR